jgi:antitoxin YefM
MLKRWKTGISDSHDRTANNHALLSLRVRAFRSAAVMRVARLLYRGTVQFMKTRTYSDAREHLAAVIDEVISTREAEFITRRGYETVAIIPAEELAGLLETAHLLRSPKNARRLLSALLESYQGEGKKMTIDEIRLLVDR